MNIKKAVESVVSRINNLVKPITAYLNDPQVPVVTTTEIQALPGSPPFVVQGFTGMDGRPGSSQHHAAITYTFIIHGLKSVGDRLGTPLNRWARTRQLVVMPRAGNQLNAYYDGASLRFFYSRGRDGNMVYTCESSDVVCHELGHAILDILRPDLWSSQSVESTAFHESFGDMVSIVAALCHDEMVDYVLQETGNNLRNSNVVSRVAEQLGQAIYGPNAKGLRNAVNEFKYVSPEKLPSNAQPEVLAREPHSFSRVFTGAFYDVLVLQYEKNLLTMDNKAALKLARDQVGSVLFNGVIHAANVTKFFGAVARAMQVTDADTGGKCADSLETAFRARGILEKPPAFNGSVMMMDVSHAVTHRHKDGFTMRMGGVKKVKLVDEMVLTQSNNPLYGIDIEVPNDHYLEYDGSGKCKAEIPVDKETTLTSAKMCLDYLHENDKVSYNDDHDKEFSVVDGKLVRNFICCKK